MDKVLKKIKQIAAIIAIIIILSLYIVTLVLAIMNNSYTHKFFYASLYATFFVPLILYVFIWLANVFRSYNPNLNKNVSDTNKHNNIDSSKTSSNNSKNTTNKNSNFTNFDNSKNLKNINLKSDSKSDK